MASASGWCSPASRHLRDRLACSELRDDLRGRIDQSQLRDQEEHRDRDDQQQQSTSDVGALVELRVGRKLLAAFDKLDPLAGPPLSP